MEYMNLYNDKKQLTTDVLLRSKNNKENVPEGRYYMVVFLIMENLDGEYLFQLTSPSKHSEIALTGGHVKKGSNAILTVCEETYEELGITLDKENLELIQSIKLECEFHEVFYIKGDFKIQDMTLDKNEVESVKYYTIKEIKTMLKDRVIRQSNRGMILDFLWNISRKKEI